MNLTNQLIDIGLTNMSSAEAEMDDRFATIDMALKCRAAVPLSLG